MSLTNREKELVKSSKLSLEEIINERNRFWTKEYPKFGFRKKVNHWLPSIHHSMRMAGETTGDEYNAFSKTIYEQWKEQEPNFDKVFESVIPKLHDFNIAEYKKRIKS